MSKAEIVPVQIPDRVLAQPVGLGLRCLHDFDPVGAVELVELVGIADDEIHGAPLGSWRALVQEYLHMTQVHASKRRWVALGEGQDEAELFRVEVGGGKDVADRQGRVVLFAVDLRGGDRGHGVSFLARTRSRIPGPFVAAMAAGYHFPGLASAGSLGGVRW